MNFLMFKLVLEKAEEPEIKLPTSAVSSKKEEFQKNIYFCFIDYAKAFDCVYHNKLWKILKDMGIPSIAVRGLFSSCREQGLLSSCNAPASHCGCRAQALGARASVVAVQRLISCDLWP